MLAGAVYEGGLIVSYMSTKVGKVEEGCEKKKEKT